MTLVLISHLVRPVEALQTNDAVARYTPTSASGKPPTGKRGCPPLFRKLIRSTSLPYWSKLTTMASSVEWPHRHLPVN